MPVPNDLSPEDEAEFAQHGIIPAGPGKEPVIENDNDIQDQGQQGPVQDDEPPQRAERPRDPTTGRFLSADEIEAEKVRAEQQPQGQQQGQQQQDDQGGEPKMVPLAALHQERARVAEISRRAALAESRMNAMIMAERSGQQGPKPLPDLNDDPVGYVRGLEERLNALMQERETETETRRLDSAIEQDEELFKQTAPDYDVASDYYVASRARELLQFYPPDQAQQIMMAEARQIAQQAWQRGTSAGSMIYNLAMARGYNPNAQGQYQQEPQNQGQQQGQPQGGSAQDTVRAIRQNRKDSRSLSGGAGGAGGATALNAAALLEMSDEEFEEHLSLGRKGANARFAAIG